MALDNIACTFGYSPEMPLNIHASAKGLVHGDLRIGLETGVLDCSNGILIPRDDLVMSVEFEGRFVLVVEKDAVFHTIAADHDHLEESVWILCTDHCTTSFILVLIGQRISRSCHHSIFETLFCLHSHLCDGRSGSTWH